MRHLYLAAMAVLVCLHSATPAFCQDEPDNPWPREIQLAQGTILIYQPQSEQLDGDKLNARAAISVELKDSEGPVFGVVWFTARLETDRAERTATLADIDVTRTRFPEQDEAKADQLKKLLETEIPKWGLSISMERLLATLELREQRIAAASQISTDAPVILFLPEPAVMITLDGEPRLKKEEGSDLMRVIKTPFAVLLD